MEKYEPIINTVVRQFDNLEYSLREDLKQELRIFLFNNIKKFEETALNINNYLFIVLKRKVINLLKSETYRRYYSLNNATETGEEYINMFSSAENVEENTENEKYMLFIEQNLLEEERKLLNQYYFNNLTFKELSSIYKISSEAVRKRLKKIIEKIRKGA